jgi:hypothetical protein
VIDAKPFIINTSLLLIDFSIRASLTASTWNLVVPWLLYHDSHSQRSFRGNKLVAGRGGQFGNLVIFSAAMRVPRLRDRHVASPAGQHSRRKHLYSRFSRRKCLHSRFSR